MEVQNCTKANNFSWIRRKEIILLYKVHEDTKALQKTKERKGHEGWQIQKRGTHAQVCSRTGSTRMGTAREKEEEEKTPEGKQRNRKYGKQ
jgi:hypothetical protein